MAPMMLAVVIDSQRDRVHPGAFKTSLKGRDTPVQLDDLRRAARDYLPPRDLDMLEFMELLAVFEASNRRMLPPKYASLKAEDFLGIIRAV